MSRFVFKLPDLGEGTVEAEIVAWRVKPGDEVSEDDVLAEVMTEKAAVEVPAPVSGKVISTTGQPGDMVAVGSELVVLETASGAASGADAGAGVSADGGAKAGGGATPASAGTGGKAGAGASAGAAAAAGAGAERPIAASNGSGSARIPSGLEKGAIVAVGNGAARHAASAAANGGAASTATVTDATRRVLTSPAIRRRAKEAGIDLRQVSGSGPQGRIVRQDFEAYAAARSAGRQPPVAAVTSLPGARAAAPAQVPAQRPSGGTEEIKVIGLRRLIAQRMTDAKRNI